MLANLVTFAKSDPNGDYDRVLLTKPRLCQAGYFCFANQMIACPTGTYSAQGAATCTVIQPGQMWVAANHPPRTCP